jgi:hypothetical protein
VTVDDSEFNRALFAGCRIESFESRNGAAKADSGARFREIIVTPAL